MAAGQVDLVFEQGATIRKKIIWQDSTGTPIDLTGYTARMQVRTQKLASTITLDLTTVNGGLIIGVPATNGEITIFVDDTTTAALTPSVQVYDLEMVDAAGSGDVTRLIEGEVEIIQEVTR
jgi:hypothetical protein